MALIGIPDDSVLIAAMAITDKIEDLQARLASYSPSQRTRRNYTQRQLARLEPVLAALEVEVDRLGDQVDAELDRVAAELEQVEKEDPPSRLKRGRRSLLSETRREIEQVRRQPPK